MPTTETENSEKIKNAEYAEIHLKGKDISNKYAQLQLAMWFENVKDAEIQLTKDMLQMVNEQKAARVSQKKIIDSLTSYAETHGFESFLNESATNLWQAMKKVSQNNLYDSLPMANLYQWQMNPGAKHCEVCSRLNGQIKSIEEWREDGLPGHRQEGCYANCCCDLVKIKSHRTRDIRERNDAGIHKRYEQEELKEDATAEEIKKNNEKPKPGFYVEKLKEEFKEIKFSGIEKFDNVTNYKYKLMGDIKVNYAEQVYIALNYAKKTIGETALNGVKKIELTTYVIKIKDEKEVKEKLPENTYGEFNRVTSILSINEQIFTKDGTSVLRPGLNPVKISDTIIHELTHSMIWKNDTMDKRIEMNKFLSQNKDFLYDRFPVLLKYKEFPSRAEEVYVRVVAAHYAGTLDNKNYKNANKYKKEHEMLKQLAHRLISSGELK